MLRDLLTVRRLGPAWLVVLALVVIADLLVIGANLIFLTADEPGREPTHPVFSDPMWNGEVDNSWMERVGQVQLLGAIVACVILRVREGDGVYLTTAALLGWIFLDDTVRVHERGGHLFREAGVDPILGVHAQDLGELAVWGIAGLVFLLLYAVTYRRAGSTARRRTRSVLLAFAVLLFFALGIDIIDGVVTPFANSWIRTGLAMLESIGELAAIGMILALTLVQAKGLDERGTPPERIDSARHEQVPVAASA